MRKFVMAVFLTLLAWNVFAAEVELAIDKVEVKEVNVMIHCYASGVWKWKNLGSSESITTRNKLALVLHAISMGKDVIAIESEWNAEEYSRLTCIRVRVD